MSGEFRSGYVTILGRPNVGKSTLMNHILGTKISIVSQRPQTTRNRILGVHHGSDYQMIFLDTPGVHRGRDAINKAMVDAALRTLEDASVVLLLVEATSKPGGGDRYIAEHVVGHSRPVILGVNKLDAVSQQAHPPLLAGYAEMADFDEVFPVSALTGKGVDALVDGLAGYLPEGPQYFPDDALTDAPERFFAAELVREKCFQLLRQELPYGIAVVIEDWEDDPERQRTTIHAAILVEKESQKGIVIGKKGAMLKKIGTEARIDLEKLLDTKIVLKLWVKVRQWTKDRHLLRELGLAE